MCLTIVTAVIHSDYRIVLQRNIALQQEIERMRRINCVTVFQEVTC